MSERDTGFHRLDPDWTRGRQKALDEADAVARRQDGMARRITLDRPEGMSERDAPEMPKRVRLDPDYKGYNEQVVGWADGVDAEVAGWPLYHADAEVADLRAEVERLREALTVIVDSYDARSELFTNDEDCAANLADRARAAVKGEGK